MAHYDNSLIQNQPFGTSFDNVNPNPVGGDSCQPRTEVFMPQWLLSDTLYLQFKIKECGENILCDWDWNEWGDDQMDGEGLFATDPALNPDWTIGVGWSYNSSLDAIYHPAGYTNAMDYLFPGGGASKSIYRLTYRVTLYEETGPGATGVFATVANSGIGISGTLRTADGLYVEDFDFGTNDALYQITFNADNNANYAISEVKIEILTEPDCVTYDNLEPDLVTGALCHTSVYSGSASIAGLLTIGQLYKVIIECESTTGYNYLQNGAQTIEILDGINEFYIYAYTPDLIISCDADSDACITNVEIIAMDTTTATLVQELVGYELPHTLESYKTTYKDYVTYIIPLTEATETLNLSEGCYHFVYQSTCLDESYNTNTFLLKTELDSCQRLIEAVGDCEQFGFYFGSGFKLSQRQLITKYWPTYPSKQDNDTSSTGEYRRQFAIREKKYTFEIDHADEQFYDCLSVQLLLDLTIDGISYFWKENTLSPEWDKDKQSELAQVAIELYVGGAIRKNNCDECSDAGEFARCVSTISFDTEIGDRLTFNGLLHDGSTYDVFDPVIDYTDITALEAALNALGYGLWTLTLVGSALSITFEQYGNNISLEALWLEDQSTGDFIYIPFTGGTCEDSPIPALITFDGKDNSGTLFDDWFYLGNTVYCKSCETGIELKAQFADEWVALNPATTVEWVGYVAPAVMSTAANCLLGVTGSDSYQAEIQSTGAPHLSNTIIYDTSLIPCGYLNFGPATDTYLNTMTAVDNNDGTWTLTTDAVGDVTAHVYNSNNSWKKIFNGVDGTVVSTVINTGSLTCNVSETGVYAYFADDILGGGYVAPFVKIV